MRGRGSRRSWSGADVASVAVSRRRRRRARSAGSRRGLKHRNARLQGLHGRLVSRFGELHGPGRLVAGIDLEEAGAVIAAREAIFGSADGELLFPRAHEGLAGPFAAAIVVDRIDVVEAGDERAAQHGLAAAGGDVPPALGGPAFVLLVTDRDPDPVAGIVAEAEIGPGRLGGHCECGHDERGAGERARGRRKVQRVAPNSSSRIPVFHPASKPHFTAEDVAFYPELAPKLAPDAMYYQVSLAVS